MRGEAPAVRETNATLVPNGLYCFFIKKGGGNKKVLQNVARFIENKDICSYKTKVNLQKTKKNWHVMVTMKRPSDPHSLV